MLGAITIESWIIAAQIPSSAHRRTARSITIDDSDRMQSLGGDGLGIEANRVVVGAGAGWGDDP